MYMWTEHKRTNTPCLYQVLSFCYRAIVITFFFFGGSGGWMVSNFLPYWLPNYLLIAVTHFTILYAYLVGCGGGLKRMAHKTTTIININITSVQRINITYIHKHTITQKYPSRFGVFETCHVELDTIFSSQDVDPECKGCCIRKMHLKAPAGDGRKNHRMWSSP